MGYQYDESPIREKEHEEIEPECSICGSKKCDYFYYQNGAFIGCDDCIRRVDVYEA